MLITGGCKNGKSTYAENIIVSVSKKDNRYYIATMKPTDEEDLIRIERHIEQRAGYDFVTIEKERDVDLAIQYINENSSVLLDSSTALLSNEMFSEDGVYNKQVYKKVCNDILKVSENVKNIVVVSDYIYSDSYEYDEMVENYRMGLAYIDKELAKKFDVVIEMCFSVPIFLKGSISL